MAKIKSHTDLPQSKKLAELLPLESADMYFEEVCNLPKAIVGSYILHNQCMEDKDYKKLSHPVLSPAWSLAALLDTFPKGEYKDVDLCFGGYQGDKYIPEWCCSYEQQEPFIIEVCHADNPVDACVAMIEKLHELKIL